MHSLLWMNVMLDLIRMVFAEMWTTFRKGKFQNDNVYLRWESNQRTLAFQRAPLTTRLSGLLTTSCLNFYDKYGGGLYDDKSALITWWLPFDLGLTYFDLGTRQIIRYRATATLRRPQKSNIQPQNRGVTKPTGTSNNFDKVWGGAPDGRFGK